MSLSSQILYRGFVNEPQIGFYARFDKQDQIEHFAFYFNGEIVGPSIDLDVKQKTGRAKDGTQDFYSEYVDGKVGRYDSWSDNDSDKKINYEDWVKSWVQFVYATVIPECGFCTMKPNSTSPLFEALSSMGFICESCVRAIGQKPETDVTGNSRFKTKRIKSGPADELCYYCTRTGQTFLIEGPRQKICSECLPEFENHSRPSIQWGEAYLEFSEIKRY